MNSNDGPPPLLWSKYMFNGELREINLADKGVTKILWTGPGMIEVHMEHGVIDSVCASEMHCRTKVDQIKTPDLHIVS